jgi:hypothetical protein
MKALHLRVVAVSGNANSFGLRGHILFTEDGQALQCGLNHLNAIKQGTILRFTWMDAEWGDGSRALDLIKSKLITQHGAELTQALENPPDTVFAEGWKGTVLIAGSRQARPGLGCVTADKKAEREVLHPETLVCAEDVADAEWLKRKKRWPGWSWQYIKDWYAK